MCAGNGRRRAAIIVASKKIDVILINQLSGEDIIVAQVSKGNFNFIVVSAYFDISTDINAELSEIDSILNFAKGKPILIAIDSNARSELWYDKLTNAKGKPIEKCLMQNHFLLINQNGEYETYKTLRGSSNVD